MAIKIKVFCSKVESFSFDDDKGKKVNLTRARMTAVIPNHRFPVSFDHNIRDGERFNSDTEYDAEMEVVSKKDKISIQISNYSVSTAAPAGARAGS